jgi:FlaA1/EpsC-like NDP-sugar epimerase
MSTTRAMPSQMETILGRPPYGIDPTDAAQALKGKRILITGALGSIGAAVRDALASVPCTVTATDIDDMDVRDARLVHDRVFESEAEVILHLAGAKHAPEGEIDPVEVAMTNSLGTSHVLAAARAFGARVVTASTCKACNPQTAYGASKLIAERATLNAGGTVARFHNVVESSGNVFRIWEDLPEHAMIPVTPCSRYFITLDEATSLVLTAAALEPGRYCVNPGRRPRPMPSVAAALYPDRPQEFIPARRGDRLNEPIVADEERVTPVSGWMWRIDSPYDRVSE